VMDLTYRIAHKRRFRIGTKYIQHSPTILLIPPMAGIILNR